MTIGDSIRYFREIMGMSQSELARRIGKTPGAISQYEAGKVNPRFPILERIADALDVPTYYLVGDMPSTYEYATVRMDLTQEEETLIGVFRSMPADKREQLMRIARSL